MHRLALIVLAAVVLPSAAAAQTYGQPRYATPPAPYGQPYGGPTTYGGHDAGYGDPRAYRAPGQYGHGHDRGGRYGYSSGGQWTRWSSPPGRGYHDVYGYNDDRAPRGTDRGRRPNRDCQCATGAYLYDR